MPRPRSAPRLGVLLLVASAVVAVALAALNARAAWHSVGQDVFAVALDGAQQVPPVATGALGAAVLSYNRATRVLSVRVSHTVNLVTAAHIHGPAAAGANAGHLFEFASAASPIVQSFTLDDTTEGYLFSGLMYINVHSQTFSAGEVRGQVTVQRTFAALLDGSQVSPPVTTIASGVAVARLNAATGQLDLLAIHNLPSVQTATLQLGPAYLDSWLSRVLTTAMGGNPVNGTYSVNAIEALAFQRSNISLQINSTFPQGVLRGQFYPCQPRPYPVTHGVVASGNVGPTPTGSQAMGVGVFSLVPAFNYHDASLTATAALSPLSAFIVHNVSFPTAAHLHGPAWPWETSSSHIADFQSGKSPLEAPFYLSGASTLAMLGNFVYSDLYLNIHSLNFTAGEIRGNPNQNLTHAAIAYGGDAVPGVDTAARGVLYVTLTGNQLEYHYQHAVASPTSVELRTGALGSNGALVATLVSGMPHGVGSVVITNSDVTNINSRNVYWVVNTAANPNGEIRGQVEVASRYSAASRLSVSIWLVLLLVAAITAVLLGMPLAL